MKPDALHNKLSAEARELDAPFSPALHERIVRAVSQTRMVANPSHGNAALRWTWPALAAAAAIGMIVWLNWPTGRAIAPPVVVSNIAVSRPEIPSITVYVRNAAEPFESTLSLSMAVPSPMASLDQDARALGKYLVRQLDQFPTDDAPRGVDGRPSL